MTEEPKFGDVYSYDGERVDKRLMVVVDVSNNEYERNIMKGILVKESYDERTNADFVLQKGSLVWDSRKDVVSWKFEGNINNFKIDNKKIVIGDKQ